MRKPTEIESLYIDFDAFFANVEKQLAPAIRERPVGVTSLESEYSGFITCCYMAKAAGIKRGTRAKDAREICPNIAVRVARPDVYVEIHNKILAEIDRHVPVQKVWSIDEAECRLIGDERKNARELALNIRDGLEKNIGRYITPSIGLAPNQFLAKVAAEMNKPRGLTILRPEDLPGPLLTLRLKDLPGISKNMERRLVDAGVKSVEDFWNITAAHARKIWGSVEGERMWLQLRGYEVHRPPTTKRMFGHGRVLTGEFKNPARAIDALHLLTVKAAYRMRRSGYCAGSIWISLRGAEGRRWAGERSFSPVSDDFTFVRHMRDLYATGLKAMNYPRSLFKISVTLHKISQPKEMSLDLFAPPVDSKQGQFDHLMEVIDAINVKNGRAMVHVGTRAKLPGGYAGAKIAFGRIPDKEDFY